MRGSPYYQSAQLTKQIFIEGAKKQDKVNEEHEYYNCVSSFKTMETYRSVWNNFFLYLREHFTLKNCELITSEYVEAYFHYKLEYYCSQQYAEKISSALCKLEFALNKYSKQKYENSDKEPIEYDFSIRKTILKEAKKTNLIASNYHNRTCQNPEAVIDCLQDENHKIAASIQWLGGARVEAVTLIKSEQLKGTIIDKITKKKSAILETKEKGGKIGSVMIDLVTYKKLEKHLSENGKFKILYQAYLNDLKQACVQTSQENNGSHSLRWSFCQRRVREYQQAGYSYYEAIQAVSWEMKHFRAKITEHYLA